MPNTRWLGRWMVVLLVGMVTSTLGIKRFEAWEQVTDLWDTGVSPLLLAATGHPHFFRFLTAYPGFLLEDAYPEIGFSIYISLFFATNVVLWRKIAFFATGRAPVWSAWLVFLAAHVFMNGRGVIAWTGWLLCIWLCLRLTRGEVAGFKPLLVVAISCWLAAVSTGVFIVVVAAFSLFYAQYRRRTRGWGWRKTVVLAIAMPLLFYVVQYLMLAIQKNIDFFGGGFAGVYHMLAHGLGRVLFGSELLAVVLVSAAAFLLLFMSMLVKMRGRPFTPVEKLMSYAAFGGLFGLTVLTLAVPLAIIYGPARKIKPVS
jgi:hypothetical protein